MKEKQERRYEDIMREDPNSKIVEEREVKEEKSSGYHCTIHK